MAIFFFFFLLSDLSKAVQAYQGLVVNEREA